jgi:dihydroorotase
MKILIKNGQVVDSANNLNEVLDILVEDTKIAKVGKAITEKADRIIDAAAKIVMPGLVDMHVHLREPGREDKETIYSGTKAALKGGVTSLLAMPNTQPAIDSSQQVKLVRDIAKENAHCNVFVAAAITKGRLGKILTNFSQLKHAGACALTDDGASVDNEPLLLTALKQAKKQKMLLIEHCEDKALSGHGVINLGLMSTRLGLKGAPKQAEFKRLQRNLQLAEKSKAAIHIAHVSCKESVEIIAKAKKKGIKVSAETAPHYFTFSDQALAEYDTNLKVNPPLRGKEDLEAIRQGLKNAVIDCIATDHAPHTINEKAVEFEYAEFGCIGLETLLAASITELIEKGLLGWTSLVQKLSVNPARILNIDRGSLARGSTADIIVVNPHKEWTVTVNSLISKSKNSPFLGKKLKGLVEYTILSGEIAYQMSP